MNPKYKPGDTVKFLIEGKIKTGTIVVADECTFFSDLPSYDIICKEENALYKHVNEDLLL